MTKPELEEKLTNLHMSGTLDKQSRIYLEIFLNTLILYQNGQEQLQQKLNSYYTNIDAYLSEERPEIVANDLSFSETVGVLETTLRQSKLAKFLMEHWRPDVMFQTLIEKALIGCLGEDVYLSPNKDLHIQRTAQLYVASADIYKEKKEKDDDIMKCLCKYMGIEPMFGSPKGCTQTQASIEAWLAKFNSDNILDFNIYMDLLKMVKTIIKNQKNPLSVYSLIDAEYEKEKQGYKVDSKSK